MAAWYCWFSSCVIIRGIKDRKFNSIPNHIVSHVVLETVIKVPTIMVEENNVIDGRDVIIKDEGS